MEIVLTAPRSELGVAVARAHSVARPARPQVRVVINLGLQPPNTLLHDGHRWKRYGPQRLLAETRAALATAEDADFLVHASYLFLGAAGADRAVGERVRAIAEGALEAEERVLGGRVPSCVVRLGYMYGPESRDLRLYRNAFRIGRPYWAGSSRVLQRHLHSGDAATALLAAARQRPAGKTLCAADDTPASFAAFMDQFARLVGNPLPLHIPRAVRPLTRLLIAEEHVQMVDLASADAPDRPWPRGWTPLFPDYGSGLRDVVNAWA